MVSWRGSCEFGQTRVHYSAMSDTRTQYSVGEPGTKQPPKRYCWFSLGKPQLHSLTRQ